MATIDAGSVREAREAFPGPCVPRWEHGSPCPPGCSVDHPGEYRRWVRRMAMWAFAHGTVLLAAAELDHPQRESAA